MSRSPVTDTDIYEKMDTHTGHRKTIPFEEDLIRQEQDTKNQKSHTFYGTQLD
jgi:hypothetical protein